MGVVTVLRFGAPPSCCARRPLLLATPVIYMCAFNSVPFRRPMFTAVLFDADRGLHTRGRVALRELYTFAVWRTDRCRYSSPTAVAHERSPPYTSRVLLFAAFSHGRSGEGGDEIRALLKSTFIIFNRFLRRTIFVVLGHPKSE